jgi:hypothetical protein
MRGCEDARMLQCDCGGERGRSDDALKGDGSSKQWCEQEG